MRIKGKIIQLGNVNSTELSGGGLWHTRTIVMGHGPEFHNIATIEVVGDRVMRLQELKVGDPITLEFRGKWYLIRKDNFGKYTVVQADSVEI